MSDHNIISPKTGNKSGGSREMDFTGKVFRGFLFISPEGFDNESDLDFWVEKALAFNEMGLKAEKKK